MFRDYKTTIQYKFVKRLVVNESEALECSPAHFGYARLKSSVFSVDLKSSTDEQLRQSGDRLFQVLGAMFENANEPNSISAERGTFNSAASEERKVLVGR